MALNTALTPPRGKKRHSSLAPSLLLHLTGAAKPPPSRPHINGMCILSFALNGHTMRLQEMQHRQKGRSVIGDDTRQDGLLLLRLDLTLGDLYPSCLTHLLETFKREYTKINTHYVRCIWGLIIKGTIPRVPAFFLWFWDQSLLQPIMTSKTKMDILKGELVRGKPSSINRLRWALEVPFRACLAKSLQVFPNSSIFQKLSASSGNTHSWIVFKLHLVLKFLAQIPL